MTGYFLFRVGLNSY